jgi:hypothetical protein
VPTADEEREDLDRPQPRPADNFVPLLESNDPETHRRTIGVLIFGKNLVGRSGLEPETR